MRLAGARSAAPEWPSRKPSGGGPSRTRPTHSNTKSVPTTQSSLSTELDHGIDMIDVPSWLLAHPSTSPRQTDARTGEHNHKLQTIRKTISKNDPLSLSGTCLKARGVHGPGIFGTLNSRPRCFIAHTISQDVTGDSKSKILARLVAKRSEHKSKITKHKLPDGRWASQDQEGGSSSSGNIQPAILSATYLGVRKDNRVAVPLGSGADSLTREQVSEVQRPLYPLVRISQADGYCKHH